MIVAPFDFITVCYLVAATTCRSESEGLVGEQLAAHSESSGENGEAVSRTCVSLRFSDGRGRPQDVRDDDAQGQQLGRDLLEGSQSLGNGVCCEEGKVSASSAYFVMTRSYRYGPPPAKEISESSPLFCHSAYLCSEHHSRLVEGPGLLAKEGLAHRLPESCGSLLERL